MGLVRLQVFWMDFEIALNRRNDFKWSLMDRVIYKTVLKIRFQLLLSSQACLAVENRFVLSKYFLDAFLLNESKGSLVRI